MWSASKSQPLQLLTRWEIETCQIIWTNSVIDNCPVTVITIEPPSELLTFHIAYTAIIIPRINYVCSWYCSMPYSNHRDPSVPSVYVKTIAFCRFAWTMHVLEAFSSVLFLSNMQDSLCVSRVTFHSSVNSVWPIELKVLGRLKLLFSRRSTSLIFILLLRFTETLKISHLYQGTPRKYTNPVKMTPT